MKVGGVLWHQWTGVADSAHNPPSDTEMSPGASNVVSILGL